MEKLLETGKTKAIGVCNVSVVAPFPPKSLSRPPLSLSLCFFTDDP